MMLGVEGGVGLSPFPGSHSGALSQSSFKERGAPSVMLPPEHFPSRTGESEEGT